MSPDPAVRLAYNPGPINAYGALDAPSVRLAVCQPSEGEGGALGARQVSAALSAPTIRLAHGPQRPHETDVLHTPPAPHDQRLPAILVSYYYLKPFLTHRHRYHFRNWVMDCGAFSAHQMGVDIDLNAYIAQCQESLRTDPQCVEVFALDVIGDWRGTLKNTEAMWAAGIPAIPCFHADEPWDALVHMATHYPKIALGGIALARTGKKMAWAEQCFARVHRAVGHLTKIHGFGFGSEKAIMTLPFHSVDATNWEIGPCKFGRWQRYGRMSVRGSQQNLRGEVEWYLELERRAQHRWRREMAALQAQDSPTVRLAVQQGAESQILRSGLTSPTVRLAMADVNPQGHPRHLVVFGDPEETP